MFKLRVEQYTEKLLQDLIVQRVGGRSQSRIRAEAFRLHRARREQYLVNKSQLSAAREVRASHILVDTNAATTPKKRWRRSRCSASGWWPVSRSKSSPKRTPTTRAARTNKGDLGFFGTGRMDPAFETAAFALTQPMEISEPVKSQFGYHIIRLEEARPQNSSRSRNRSRT